MADVAGPHLSEEQLTEHFFGEVADPALASHLTQCPQCRNEFELLKAALAMVDTLAAPNPEPGYEGRLWRALVEREPAMGRRRRESWWRVTWVDGLAWAGSVAALMLVAFFTGRFTSPKHAAVDIAAVRERVLIAALSEHLEQSERILLEIDNQSLGDERQRVENLLAANRLYRQSAMIAGQESLVATLEDLERVLLDVAHAPVQLSAAQLQLLQVRLEDQSLLFKVQSLGARIRQQTRQPISKSMKG